MITTDQPINKAEQDKLKRLPLAKRIAEIISRYEDKNKESFVIGIDGAWGSGKTSFVNLILQELGETVIHFEFNPWLFSDQASLLQNFFDTFADSIKPYVPGAAIRNVKKYAKMVGDVDLGVSAYGISINPLKWLSLLSDDSLAGQRSELNAALVKIPKKIVVVIDDIDRLDPEETKLIFKLIKVSANFQNTIFLIAYDRKRVAAQLTDDKARFDGNEYLKKIVQVNFLLPQPEPEELWDLLFADLNQTLKDIYQSDDVGDDARWSELFHGGLSKLFKTLRDVKSFINSLNINWSIMGGSDVHPIDFIGIEAIRVFAPEFYSSIAGNETLFTGELALFAGLSRADDIKAREAQYEKLLEVVPEAIRPTIDAITKKLFPQLEEPRQGDETQAAWRRDRRVCSKEKFRYYFTLGIPRGSISEAELRNVLKSLDNKADFIENLRRYDSEKKLRKLLARLLDFINSLTSQQVKNLALGVWEVQVESKDTRSVVWDFDDLDSASTRLVYNSIKKAVPMEERAAFITDLLKEGKEYFPSIEFARLLVSEHAKKGESGQALISNGIEEIKKVALDRVKEMAADGTLKRHQKLIYLLYSWRDFGEEEQMKEFVRGLLGTTEGLLEFLGNSIHWVLSSTGNYEDVGRQDIGGLYPIEDFQKLVDKLTDEDLKKATDRQRQGVELFKNPRKPW